MKEAEVDTISRMYSPLADIGTSEDPPSYRTPLTVTPTTSAGSIPDTNADKLAVSVDAFVTIR